MAQRHSIVTVVGRNKEAAKTAANQPIVFTEIALGDGTRFPSGGETELENEVHRGQITGSGVEAAEPNAVWFDLYVPANVNTFYAQEIGLFDEDGLLYAVSRFDQPVPKFGPDSSSLSDNTFRIVVVFSDTENVVVNVSPVTGITAENLPKHLPFASSEEALDDTTTGKILQVGDAHKLFKNRTINTGTGLSGGGDLSSDRTLFTDWSNLPKHRMYSQADLINVRTRQGQSAMALGRLASFFRASPEEIQDIVAAYLKGQGISVVYDDAGNALTLEVGNATTQKRGIVELATGAETLLGKDHFRAVTPHGLSLLEASESRRGLVALASDTEVLEGRDEQRAVTPAGLASLIATPLKKGLVERATEKEASSGTDDTRYITPRHLKAGLDKKANTSHQHSPEELGFRYNNASNGYQKFPNGIIYQWGQFRATFDQSGTRVVFPIAFPSFCYNVITSVHRSTRQVGGITTYTQSFSRTGCTIVGNLYSAKYGFPRGYIHWHAIGR